MAKNIHRCRVCVHPQRYQIETSVVVQGAHYRVLAQRHGLSLSDLSDHFRYSHHNYTPLLVDGRFDPRVALADTERIKREAEQLAAVIKPEDVDSKIKVLRLQLECIDRIERIARLHGLQERLIHERLMEFKNAILELVKDNPQLRKILVEKLDQKLSRISGKFSSPLVVGSFEDIEKTKKLETAAEPMEGEFPKELVPEAGTR